MIIPAVVLTLLLSPAARATHAPGDQAGEGPTVVTSLTTYAAIAREIVGDRGEVSSIASGRENPHFVTPRPSLVLQLRHADMFVVTGLDLELWVPALQRRANNARIRPGSPGWVTAADGVALLDVPAAVSRAEGDVHVFVGRNILAGLRRVSPENSAYYEGRYLAWRDRVIRALVGGELVELLGNDAVFQLAQDNRLLGFLESQEYQGRPLAERLGGWMKRAESFRGGHMVCYHKEWDYFSRAFGVSCDEYVEPKPGIPPTPQHVAKVISLMRTKGIRVLFSTNYFDRKQVESVAARTGATAVIVPSNTEGAADIHAYIELVDLWVRELAQGFDGR
jgi:ABC-type Zn uptake system ZnuABC Zn-binding protein ZnuA